MKLLHLNMYKKINYIVAVMILLTSATVKAQVTSQSPYSRYGLGNVKGLLLPQFRAMGGISTGVFKPSMYFNNINMQNPATYSGITSATVDMGLTGTLKTLKRDNASEGSFNATLNHVALAFPIKAGRTGLSFGLLPYTELGYENSNTGKLDNDTNSVTRLFSGEGGLTKAYMGIGQQFGDHFRVGVNVEYIFGNMVENRGLELQSIGSVNTKQQEKNSIGGIGFSYGAQYEIPLSLKSRITIGYSGSSPSSINSKRTFLVTRYLRQSTGEEGTAIDTPIFVENGSAKLKLPLVHNFGISIQKDNKWLIGADYRMGNWSKLSIDGVNNGLNDSWGASIGGQLTPDITSIGSYFNRVDYRLGFAYDKTYINVKDQDIKQMAVTFGLGLPLGYTRFAVSKLNFTTELGRRGTLTNGLVQENYINFHLGITLNDTWFKRFKFD
ncbi:outer membrane protein transport protein [Pedobacter hiemivivus]|nr:outer membrane protein transport protein [Pedobacter hiemivivus]